MSAVAEAPAQVSGEVLEIAALGARVVLRPPGSDSREGCLSYDVIGRTHGFVTQPHVHPDQEEEFEVIAGEMKLVTGRRSQVLRPGDRASVPAGVSHRQVPAGPGDGHVRVTISPAGRTEEFMRFLAAVSSSGGFTRAGFPKPVAAARLIIDFADAGHATALPLAVQRSLARGILAVARLWREYSFVDEWDVNAPPEAVYDALADARTYPDWWRPVYLDVAADGPAAVGAVAYQHFKGYLPYHLHTRARITRLEPPRLIEADIDGDLRGRGMWTLTPAGAGTHVRFDWVVFADRRLLRWLTPILRPVLRANHAWAIARAIDGLEPYVASGPSPPA
ncbi:MAG TPA: SRPBCC family protein [Solirubrobacteraceae bacterium]|nr:SRPBCC family protein [Solirubrobacteraceae bacterium]